MESSAPAKYRCTFEGCGTSFATAAASEEHEKKYHAQLELWKCAVGSCAHRSFRVESHAKHLGAQHHITDAAEIAAKVAEGHVHGGSFWCGFCRRVLRPGEEKWMHVAAHFENGTALEDYVFL